MSLSQELPKRTSQRKNKTATPFCQADMPVNRSPPNMPTAPPKSPARQPPPIQPLQPSALPPQPLETVTTPPQPSPTETPSSVPHAKEAFEIRMAEIQNEFSRQMQAMQALIFSNSQMFQNSLFELRNELKKTPCLANPPPPSLQSSAHPSPGTNCLSSATQQQALSQPNQPFLSQPIVQQIESQEHQQLFHHTQPLRNTTPESPFSNGTQGQSIQRHKKIYPLPMFTGLPEEWQTFVEAFNSTSVEFEYSQLHNIMRLRDALKGSARETVESLLSNSNNVNAIMGTLEETFGRPEQLIKSQIEKVRALTPIQEDHLMSLVSFANRITNMTTFLQNARGQHHLSNPSLLSELVAKLPTSKQMQWAEKCFELERPPTIVDFSQWLNKQRRLANMVTDALSSFQPVTSNSQNLSRRRPTATHLESPRSHRYAYISVAQKSCILCEGECNSLIDCPHFSKLSVDERWKKAKTCKVCFSCLKRGHQTNRCFNRNRCGLEGCLYQHHRLLHNALHSRQNKETHSTIINELQPTVESSQGCTRPAKSSMPDHRICYAENNISPNRILFQILPVKLYNHGNFITTYAFVDDGANVTMIDQQLAYQLGIRGQPDSLELQWLNDKSIKQPSEVIELTISGVEEDAQQYKLSNVYTSTNLSLPTQSFHRGELFANDKHQNVHLSGVPLSEYDNIQPKLIISLAHAFLTVPMECPRASLDSGPIAVKTRLGWIVYGPINNCEMPTDKRALHLRKVSDDTKSKMDEIYDTMKSFFEVETFGIKPNVRIMQSTADQRALVLLETKTKKLEERYEAGLLWKEDYSSFPFPDSFTMALNRLEGVERKMSRDRDYAEQYRTKLNYYISKGYARKLSPAEINHRTAKTFYLPHFGVKNPNKKGLRLVFDAAAEVGQFSLNKALLSGPDINQPLIAILFKFRHAPFAVCGDIKEMFHQVQIAKEDQDSQRFLWRDDPNDPVQTYVMERMIFGATCSPTIAQYVKNINANTYKEQFPRAVEGIVGKHYVDDYVDCFQTEDEAIEVLQRIIQIHKAGGFELRNITSNSDKLIVAAGQAVRDQSESVSVDSKVERVLEMHWLPKEDVFVYRLSFHKVPAEILNFNRKPTKRELLSINMSVFDPFGFLADFMVTAKVLMQMTWRTGIEWNEPISDDIFHRWKTWVEELPKVETVRVPRCYFLEFESVQVDLHLFADASEEAMAVVAYWRAAYGDIVEIAFVAGKSSLAPKRYHTIPKLELQAAVMAVRLMDTILKSHTVKVNKRYFWSDSHTVIRWIRSEHRAYKQYVANRVSEILESTEIDEWRWCPGKLNPADEATRSKYPMRYEPDGRWKNGPQFLRKNEMEWPNESLMGGNEDKSSDELRARHVLLAAQKAQTNWVSRFVQNSKRKINKDPLITGELTAEDEMAAERQLFYWVQVEAFAKEFVDLSNGQTVSHSSAIKSLNPFQAPDGLLRANGRLSRAACLPTEAREPIILPYGHGFTRLLLEFYHKKFHHINVYTVIGEVRQRFWIPSIRRGLNSVQYHCQVCRYKRAKPMQPQMGPLPIDRVTPYVRPFSYTGLDFFGPVSVTIRRQREKWWVALFTCLTVRAVHLEIATDLSSDACLICIRNFINRRGVPVQIRSDNGTNFVGIPKELKKARDFRNQDEKFQSGLSLLGIEWKLNTPLNPSEGGAWERLVQSVKKILYAVLKEHSPRLETLQSCLIEAENMVNSRPLTHLPVTPDEPEPLTPNHFLLGCTNSTQTPAPYEPRLMSLKKQWRIAQNLKNGMWQQWMRDYLPELTRRTKWCLPSKPLSLGCLVLICDIEAPRSNWRRGRVVKFYYGKDGIARSADVNTTAGTLKRPISKLAILDVDVLQRGEASPSGSVHGGGDVKNQDTPGRR